MDVEGLTLRIDPSFDPSLLSPEERTWYDRLLESIEACRTTIETRAAEDDTYTYGRSVGDYNAHLLLALRATGDRRFLDRVTEITEIYRAELADAWDDGTTDGFLNWRWREDPTSPYYGTDLHQMDEAMTHGNVGLIAFAFHVNRDIDPGYAEKADFWLSYLEDHFLAKWTERASGDPVAAWESEAYGFYKRLTHPRSNQLRLAYYLWRITEDPFYLERAEAIAGALLAHAEQNPEVPAACRWKHQVSGSDLGWQKVNYAQYFMSAVIEMHLEGFLGYGESGEIERYAATFSDVVFGPFSPDFPQMRERVYGVETVGTQVYGLAGFARWDPSGCLLDLADTAYRAGLAGASMAGGALMAVSRRSATPASAWARGSAAAPLVRVAPEPSSGYRVLGFDLSRSGFARLAVYDTAGRRARLLFEGVLASGPHDRTWDGRMDDGREAPAGAYFALLESAEGARIGRLTLVR